MAMPEDSTPLRSLLVPLAGGGLLLPSAVVAEVVTYSAPERLEDAPPWLLGRIQWRGQQVPVVSLEPDPASAGTMIGGERLLILYSLNQAAPLFYGLLARGIPQVFRIQEGDLEVREPAPADAPFTILRAVFPPVGEVLIPDLDQLQGALAGLPALAA